MPLQSENTTCEFCEKGFPSVSAMKDHLANSCPEKIVCCGQAGNGCVWKGRKVSLETHIDKCPYESIKGFFAIHSAQMAQVSGDNDRLRRRTEELEGTIRILRQELEWAKAALGPWYRPVYPERQSMTTNHTRWPDNEGASTRTSQTMDPVGGTFLPEPNQNPGNGATEILDFFDAFSFINERQDRVSSVHAADASRHLIELRDAQDLNGDSSSSGSTQTGLSPRANNLQPASGSPPVLFSSDDLPSRTRGWQPAPTAQNASPSMYSSVSITAFVTEMRLRADGKKPGLSADRIKRRFRSLR